MVRYNNKNMGDPLYEFEQDYQIVEVDAQHVPISGTEKLTRIVPTKGVAQDPTKAPISGVNIQEMELALQDLNKIDANHNVTLIPANVYYTDTELINYMITNGYKDITVANTTYFDPSVANGNLRIIVGDNNKYTFLYYDLGDKMYKKSGTTTNNEYVSTSLLTLVNKSYTDEKDNEIKTNLVQTNERIDAIVENVGAILESSSVPTIQNIAYPTTDTKLPIKTAAYTRQSNNAKLSFDDNLNYTFNLHELGTYNINLDYIISSTANRIVTIKLFKYVDGITDTLVYTWPITTITNNQTLNVSTLPYPLVKGVAGTEKYYITYVADGAGVTGRGYNLVVDLVVDQNTIPPSVNTDQVHSKGLTGYLDGTTSTTVFNDLIGGKVNKAGDTMTGGLSFSGLASTLMDLTKHIALDGVSYGINVYSGALNFITGGIFKFVNANGDTVGMIKSVIDDPKSLITKEYADTTYTNQTIIPLHITNAGGGTQGKIIRFTDKKPVENCNIKINGWVQKIGQETPAASYALWVRVNDDTTARSVNWFRRAMTPITDFASITSSSVSFLGYAWTNGVNSNVFGEIQMINGSTCLVNGQTINLPNSANANDGRSETSSICPMSGNNAMNSLTIGMDYCDDMHVFVTIPGHVTYTIEDYIYTTTIIQPDVDNEIETPIS